MMQHPNLSAPPPSIPQMQSSAMGLPMSGASTQMLAANTAYSAVERSQRSVFVGNIPYDATDEDLKELFSQVGPVVGFRLVLDRETGKSKGYGFCEFLDQETAASALRNLNGFEFHGRTLRIDTAAGDRSKEELRQLQMTFGGPQEENPYGPSVEPTKAPEAIGRAVASLPPEQMFELMKQMKACVQTNPNEARTMLLQNPQLAYALLQAQVVMRIVDPQVAMGMLHREPEPVPSMMPPGIGQPIGSMPTAGLGGYGMMSSAMRPPVQPAIIGSMPAGDMDYRSGYSPATNTGIMGVTSSCYMPVQQQPQGQTRPYGTTPSILDRTPAVSATAPAPRVSVPVSAPSEDQEKAALIMQVLQLTDEQIALLPPDQKQSVLLLREQLRGAQR